MFELTLCIASLTFALPMSVALFNQRSAIEREKLEPEFQDIKDPKSGETVNQFYYNKGL